MSKNEGDRERKPVAALQSALHGVIVGVTIAVVLGAYDRVSDTIERRYQERHIGQSLSAFLCDIHTEGERYSGELLLMMKLGLYQSMIDRLRDILDNRSTKMTYDRKEQAWRSMLLFFDEKTKTISRRPTSYEDVTDLRLDIIVDSLRDVEWRGFRLTSLEECL